MFLLAPPVLWPLQLPQTGPWLSFVTRGVDANKVWGCWTSFVAFLPKSKSSISFKTGDQNEASPSTLLAQINTLFWSAVVMAVCLGSSVISMVFNLVLNTQSLVSYHWVLVMILLASSDGEAVTPVETSSNSCASTKQQSQSLWIVGRSGSSIPRALRLKHLRS